MKFDRFFETGQMAMKAIHCVNLETFNKTMNDHILAGWWIQYPLPVLDGYCVIMGKSFADASRVNEIDTQETFE